MLGSYVMVCPRLEIPGETVENELYVSYKKLSESIYDFIKDFGKEKRIAANTDIYEYTTRGYFKLLSDGKQVRWYSQYDFIFSPEVDFNHIPSLISEFATVIALFDKKSLFDATHVLFQAQAFSPPRSRLMFNSLPAPSSVRNKAPKTGCISPLGTNVQFPVWTRVNPDCTSKRSISVSVKNLSVERCLVSTPNNGARN